MLTHRHIQEEIIEDILSWLPVKSLFRFMCVSKSWRALICEPSFKKKHFNHPKNDKLLIQRGSKDGSMTFYCSSLLTTTSHGIVTDVHESLRVPRYYMVHCCCDGLFLIGMWTGDNQKNFLWNPSTRESVPLPSHYNDFFDSSLYGLGYDSTSDDYKVFKVPEGDESATMEILSLKMGSWRKIDVDYDCVRFEYSDSMDDLAFVHGSFHWLASLDQGLTLISFNISNEVFGELPLPEEMHLRQYPGYDQGVTVLGEMLSVNCVDVKDNSIVYDLWVMKEYGIKESWTKLFTMRDTWNREELLLIIPKYIFADGEVLLNYTRSVFRTFKESEGRSNVIGPLVTHEDTSSRWDGFGYTESLISPKDYVLA